MDSSANTGVSQVRLVLLHPDDNVLVVCQSARAGDRLRIDGQRYRLADDIALGHKIARADLKAGDKVIKYGVPIGSVTRSIPKGGHVHVANMKSDYIAGHDRAGGPPLKTDWQI